MAAASQIDLMQEGALAHLPMPYMWRPPVPMSDEELMAFSRLHRPYRIERTNQGELAFMTPVGGRGGRLESRVNALLDNWAYENGGCAFSPSSGFKLPDGSILSPDTAWVSEERWDALDDGQQEGFPPLCPDFVVEVRSASDSRKALEAKMELWMANGAKLAWLIDPAVCEARIYRAGEPTETLHAPEFISADAVVTGFKIDLRKLWIGHR